MGDEEEDEAEADPEELQRPEEAGPLRPGDAEEGEDDTAQVPHAWIVEAKLVLNDQLMKRGAEERAARLEAESAADDAAEQE